jgi:hypothetical protein
MCAHAQHVQVVVVYLEHERDLEPPQCEGAVDGKKSTASMLVAWVRRNCRQLVSVPDRGGWDATASNLRLGCASPGCGSVPGGVVVLRRGAAGTW